MAVAIVASAIAHAPTAAAGTELGRVPSYNFVRMRSFTFDGRSVSGYIDGNVEGTVDLNTSFGTAWFGVTKRTKVNDDEMVEIKEAIYLEDVPRYRFDTASWTASASGTMPSTVSRVDWKRKPSGGWSATDTYRAAKAKVSLRWRGTREPTTTYSIESLCTGGLVVPPLACVDAYPEVTRRGPAEVRGWIDFGGLGLRVHLPDGHTGSMTHRVIPHG